MNEQLALLAGRLLAHLELTLVALLVGTGVSVPLGVLISRTRRLAQPVLAVAGVIQTVPSLALLAFMVPALAAIGAPSIGTLPALIGLVLYSVFPVLQNTVVGLSSVDPALIEAAEGVGMTPGQRLRRVELPLAMPVIVAGIRTATVWTVGTATLSTPIGAESLGNYIFSGLQTRNTTDVLVGCVAAAALALVLDGTVRALEIGLRRRRRGLVAAAIGALALLYAIAAVGFARGALGGGARRIAVGSKTFTEQYILGRVLAGKIERDTGLPTEAVESLGSMVAFDALRTGQIDAYVDYSGTLWVAVMKRSDAPADRAEVLRGVKEYLLEEHGIVVAAALGFENTYALAMRREHAERLGARTVSDLVPAARSMSIGADYEFFQRAEWKTVEQRYGIAFAKQRSMDPSLMYEAVRAGEVDVISAFSTDGRIVSFDLRVLEDDRRAIPPYDAVVLASARLAREHPEAIEALRGLEGKIDAERMRELNVAVDEQGKSPAEVAEALLRGL
ncbi:glycine betaine ABC transporter substrate-binding protein [Sorangium sp. So ce1014]|uniref:glycine betaine ABC transporter substrate-binding protein n=1 Tax=Sorangium sp. So ce1014 TaxID=3133326 RepID=UPI003F5E633E